MWTKHIEINYHFVPEKVTLCLLISLSVSSANQVANIFTKPLLKQGHQFLRSKLGVLFAPQLRGIHGPG